MSTINPLESKKIARKFLESNITMLDTPVMGGPNVAINGKLVMMASGDKKAFKKNKKIFETVAERVFFLGKSGTAHALKLAMNLQISLIALALSEGITLTRGAKIPPELFLKILNSTYFKTGMSEKKAFKMIKGNYTPTFTLRNLKKDLQTINETAKSYGLNLPMATRANSVYSVIEQRDVSRFKYILLDQTIKFKGLYTRDKYTKPLRRVRSKDPDTGKYINILTNNFTWSAKTISK